MLISCVKSTTKQGEQSKCSTEQENTSAPLEVPKKKVILNGNLSVLDGELGFFSNVPTKLIDSINATNLCGCNTWRIPTTDELAILRANGYAMNNKKYMHIDPNSSSYEETLNADRENIEVLKNDLEIGRAPRKFLPVYCLYGYYYEGVLYLVSDGTRYEHDIYCDEIDELCKKIEENWEAKKKK